MNDIGYSSLSSIYKKEDKRYGNQIGFTYQVHALRIGREWG